MYARTESAGVGSLATRALAGAAPRSFWLDHLDAPEALPALAAPTTADLAIVGGGFTGLWTALLAKERDPAADVVVLEARTAGWAASGRNGGFCSSSLTHGLENGLARFPDEMPVLERLGMENLREIGETIARHGIDCDFRLSGEISVATAPWQLDGIEEEVQAARKLGHEVETLDAGAVRRELDSPTFLGGTWQQDGTAMLEPGRLAWGLRRACLDAGVRIYEHTRVRSVRPAGAALQLTTTYGTARAGRVVLGTGAFHPLLGRIGNYVIPVYDYALMTEPMNDRLLQAIGWRNRQGFADRGNQFHYFRITRDNRILWGGYDAVYFNGGRIHDEQAQRPETFAKLAGQFFTAFPQLEGVNFTHAWGGVIDTCSRFCPFFGTAYRGKLAYAAGYTGLGVGATRFGAQVLLDLLDRADTERTRLKLVRSKPVPFPPEPARSAVIQLTRASIAQADRNDGRRNLWLRTLDRLGLGFDS
jgi:glycine/D-amino acid oxidase-like deaminating enzyme